MHAGKLHRFGLQCDNPNVESNDRITSTTCTSTFTVQQVRLTKTTTTKTKESEEDYDARALALLDKISQLEHRLTLVVPTRFLSEYRASIRGTPEGEIFEDDGNSSDNRPLHPLHAGDQDRRMFERNFAGFQTILGAFEADELQPYRDEAPDTERKAQVEEAYRSLTENAEETARQLETFRRGFSFAQVCNNVRSELDLVQMKIAKTTSSSTDTDIQDMEMRVAKTENMIKEIPAMFPDLLAQNTATDSAYQHHLDALTKKNELVRSWVEEVRIWFAEAERIREWVEIRMAKLEETSVPEPLKDISVTREQVDSLNATHQVLEKEIETFDKEDMTRLRSHVKALTGGSRSNKDLSPADTTTIEITLTTLASLEKLMHSLRRKSADLQLLTNRVAWEEELAKSHAWLDETDAEVQDFIRNKARWRSDEQLDSGNVHDRETLMMREKMRELVIQKLLLLERKRTEFDQGQYITTMDAFHDLEDAAQVDIPRFLESRQTACEQRFEDLFKRITFARQVVEQRLQVVDFLHQTNLLQNDVHALRKDIEYAQNNARFDGNDRELSSCVQTINERIVQLVTTTAGRIPWPSAPLSIDDADNEASNDDIRQVINAKRRDLLILSEQLDRDLEALRYILQLHRQAKQSIDDASRLCSWINDRLGEVQQAKKQVEAGGLSIEDLKQLEKEREMLSKRLKKEKENETVDVLTKIQTLVESECTSLDRPTLQETSEKLTTIFDRLRDTLDEHGHQISALLQKTQDDNTYTEAVKGLSDYLQSTLASLPGLKQKCGFMTGISEEQDRARLTTLENALSALRQSFRERQAEYEPLCARFQSMDASKARKYESMQQTLENDFARLSLAFERMDAFANSARSWFDRQRRLSIIDNDMLGKLDKDLDDLDVSSFGPQEFANMEQRLIDTNQALEKMEHEIAKGGSSIDDPLEIANYSCARDRHFKLVSRADAIREKLNALKQNLDNLSAQAEFRRKVEALVTEIQNEKDNVRDRLQRHRTFASMSGADIEHWCQEKKARSANSEQMANNFGWQWSQLQKEAEDLSFTAAVNDKEATVKAQLEELLTTMSVEKQQLMFARKTLIHDKAARDLHHWMDQCSNAINQIATNVCIADDAELLADVDGLERKLLEFQPTIEAFRAMPSRILSGRDGQPIQFADIYVDEQIVQAAIRDREAKVLQEWEQLLNQLEATKASVKDAWKNVEIARKVKEILTLVGHLKEHVSSLQLGRGFSEQVIKAADGDDLKIVTTCPLSMMPLESDLLAAKAELDGLDSDLLNTKLTELDAMLNASQGIFDGQRNEIATAVNGLTKMIKMKREAIALAEKLESFLVVVEELEVLLSAVSEVVEKASIKYARTIDGVPSRADLQAMLIDLDTRYRYYEPKINELVDEAEEVAQHFTSDNRVKTCLQDLKDKWAQLRTRAADRRSELLGYMGSRQSTLSKRASMPTFHPSPRPNQSTPPVRSKPATPRPQSAMATARLPPRPTPATRQRAQTRSPLRKSKIPETYVADPKNDLDVALGNIVNDSPYKVRVKMVPGEVGRYWFGDKNPKLAYCRILRSRMVMVRVGGGWVELSQFLRDHALIEGSVPRGQQQTQPNGTFQTGVVTIRGGNGGNINNNGGRNRGGGVSPVKRGASPSIRESRSTPFHRGLSPITFGHGIKDGDKFVTVDEQGNQVEVRMTKAMSKDTKFITPRRTR